MSDLRLGVRVSVTNSIDALENGEGRIYLTANTTTKEKGSRGEAGDLERCAGAW
jgi:hypothetical protein